MSPLARRSRPLRGLRALPVLRALVVLLVIAAPRLAGAQTPQPAGPAPAAASRVVGRVVDARTGAPLSDVGVQLVGTSRGATTGADGRFAFQAVAPGTLTLHARRLGYTAKTVTGILVGARATVEQDVALEPANVKLDAVVVNAASERGTVNEALDRQRTATGIVNAITAEQIAKSPDANAAQAIQRVSGVTIQDGKYVLVRGLGERYTTTSLNGARIPSADPERKVVPLDLFPAGLLQTVTTAKTFTPDQPGDFAGAAVDIRTKEFPARRTTSYSWTAGYNDAATGRAIIAAPIDGPEWLGLAGNRRALPGAVASYGNRLASLSTAQLNQVVRSFRPVWSPVQRTATPNVNTAISTGGTAGLAGRSVGYLLSGSYGMSNELQQGEIRALAVPDPSGRGGQQPFNRFVGATGRSSVLWGGMANLSSLVTSKTLVALDNMYSHTADNEARADSGFLQQGGLDAPARRSTLRFVERTTRSNQLRVEQALGGGQNVNLTVTSAGVRRDEPDRADFVRFSPEELSTGQRLPMQWLSGDDDAAKRSFSTVREGSLSYALDYRLLLGEAGREWTIRLGGAHRDTRRDVDNRTYSIYGRNLTREQLRLAPEDLFDGRFATDTSRNLVPVNNSTTGEYRATDRVTGGYVMFEVPAGRRLRVVGGARAEQWRLRIDQALPFANDPPTPARRDLDLLPSLAVNVALTETQALRLSATRTLSRPEYREVSTTQFCDMLGERCTIGNPELRRALIDNLDVRWEVYPDAGELLSAAVFAKRFHNPIERIEIGTSGASSYGFVNTNGGTNLGLELELRTRLRRLADVLAPFTAFSNVTLMRSAIEIGNADISALTNTKRPMVGQSPYVVNAGLTWSPRDRASATLLYNVVGRRIVAVGSKPVADTYELPRQGLDLSFQAPLVRAATLKLNAKNLLDARVRQTSGDVTRLEYSTGRVFSFGITWSM